MFKDRYTSTPYLIREIHNEMSFIPKTDDKAFLVIDENNIQIQVILKNKDNDTWSGEIISYHPEIKKRTLHERLEEIKNNETFINKNNLTNGSLVTFQEIKIHGLSKKYNDT